MIRLFLDTKCIQFIIQAGMHMCAQAKQHVVGRLPILSTGVIVQTKMENLRKVIRNAAVLRTGHLIDGDWYENIERNEFEVCNPANGEVLATLPSATNTQATAAVSAAHRAQPLWASKTAKERAAILMKWYELILANREDLAILMTLEQGKPLAEARGEVLFGASFVSWYAEEAKRIQGEVLQTYSADRRVLILRQPIGVVVAITPWNFPSAMITRKCAPALAAGCSIVLKPSEETPLSAIALCALAREAGIPPGVINLVMAGRDDAAALGRVLLSDDRVRKLSFTGSTATGKHLMRLAADNVLKLSLELGGNAPLIVFDDADLDRAAEGALASKFRNMGQTCTCANRILVQRGVYQAFAEKLVEKVRKLHLGPGTEENVTQGPLINSRAVEKVRAHIEDAVAKGARVIHGGHVSAKGPLFFEPTVLVDVNPEMQICSDETFGPVAPLLAFDTEEEALTLANATQYGLAGYFYTRDLSRAFRMAERLELGAIGINEAVISSEAVPIGGVKQSGIGREGAHHGIEDFLEIKQVTIGGL